MRGCDERERCKANMSQLIPENMSELRNYAAKLQKSGQKVNQKQLIQKVCLRLFQDYLDQAEEGHYDTAHLVNDHELEVLDVMQKPIGHFRLKRGTWASNFKQQALFLEMKLEKTADQIAAANS